MSMTNQNDELGDDDFPHDLSAGDIDDWDACGGLGGIDLDEDEEEEELPVVILPQPDRTRTLL